MTFALWLAVPMTIVSDKGMETGRMMEFQMLLRYQLSISFALFYRRRLIPSTGRMQHQSCPRMNSSLGFRYQASIIRQLKVSGCGYARAKATIYGRLFSMAQPKPTSTPMIRCMCES